MEYQQEIAALREAGCNPPIFRKLILEGLLNEPDSTIIECLKNNGFTRTGAITCSKSFIDTMKFIGFRS